MHNVTLIKGDGIGPSIMDEAVKVIDASGVKFTGKKHMPVWPLLKNSAHPCLMKPWHLLIKPLGLQRAVDDCCGYGI